MKGLTLLLQSMGIKIDPTEVEQAFQQGKETLPKIAKAFDEILERQKRMEEKIDKLMVRDGPPVWDIKGTPLGEKFEEVQGKSNGSL